MGFTTLLPVNPFVVITLSEVFMIEIFFHGYGSWFYEHEVSGNWFPMLFSVSPAGTTFILFPCDDDDSKEPFESIGFFNLTNEDAFAYSITKNSSLIKKLRPSPRYSRQSTIQRMADTLEIGGLRVNEDKFYFLIDRNQPFILYFDFKDPDKPTSTENPIPTETNPATQKEPKIAVHKVIYRAFNSINKPAKDISPDDVMAVIKAEFDEWSKNRVTRVFDVDGVIIDIKDKEIDWYTPNKDITPLTYVNFCRKFRELKRKACGNG